MATVHYGYVDGIRYSVKSGDIQPQVTPGQGNIGAYVVKFDAAVLSFVGTAHGNGEGCDSRNMTLTASIDSHDSSRVCVHTFRITPNYPIGSPENADFSFFVALSD